MDDRTWPLSGMLLDVRVSATGAVMRAVVDDVRPPDQLHLREPVTPTGAPVDPLPIGSSLLLTWADGSGAHELPVVLTALPALRVPVWRLAPSPTPVVLQRRAFERAPAFLRVELGRGVDRWSAGLADLGGGGARCLVADAEGLAVGDRLQLRFELDGRTLRLPAELLAVEPHDRGRSALRLRFADHDETVALLRNRVRDHQRMGLAVGSR